METFVNLSTYFTKLIKKKWFNLDTILIHNHSYPILGFSENITAIAGKLLAVSKGGNTATALSPLGTRFSVVWGAPFGEAPPPGVPGGGFPVK